MSSFWLLRRFAWNATSELHEQTSSDANFSKTTHFVAKLHLFTIDYKLSHGNTNNCKGEIHQIKTSMNYSYAVCTRGTNSWPFEPLTSSSSSPRRRAFRREKVLALRELLVVAGISTIKGVDGGCAGGTTGGTKEARLWVKFCVVLPTQRQQQQRRLIRKFRTGVRKRRTPNFGAK